MDLGGLPAVVPLCSQLLGVRRRSGCTAWACDGRITRGVAAAALQSPFARRAQSSSTGFAHLETSPAARSKQLADMAEWQHKPEGGGGGEKQFLIYLFFAFVMVLLFQMLFVKPQPKKPEQQQASQQPQTKSAG